MTEVGGNQNEIDGIIENAENMLRMAYRGYNQYKGAEGETKMVGLRNAVVFGRSVTFVLQQLRGEVGDEFDEWYDERVEVLKEDDVLSYMNDLRNQILKEGDTDLVNYASMENFNPAQLQEWAPPWADSIFIGDQIGGSGWTVEMPDGTERKFYAELPEEMSVEAGLARPREDENSLFTELKDVEEDLGFYIRVLAEMVDEAKEEFRD